MLIVSLFVNVLPSPSALFVEERLLPTYDLSCMIEASTTKEQAMSGGHFSYNQYKIDQIANDIEQLIIDNNSTELNDWGQTKGNNFSEATINELHQALYVLRVAFICAHRIDWLVSGDDSESDFHARLANDIEKLKSTFSFGAVK